MNRRDALKNTVLTSIGLSSLSPSMIESGLETKKLQGNINHSVCRWTMNHLSLDEMCLMVKRLGFSAIDLVGPSDWHILKKHGINSSMCNGAEINLVDGWNEPNNHNKLIDSYSKHIDLVADAGYKNLIWFSGNRRGMDDSKGMENCISGIKKILSKAEKKGVILQLELFNSKIDHKDYMADKSAWGIELCKRIGSPNVKLLFDIYHMQINEGDIIRSIQDNHQYFGHYHTAGVPGRNEINNSQELNYPAIMEAIVKTNYNGYVAHEFISTAKTSDGKEKSLKEAVKICDV
jgi:hydroxypyruvate isomerase